MFEELHGFDYLATFLRFASLNFEDSRLEVLEASLEAKLCSLRVCVGSYVFGF